MRHHFGNASEIRGEMPVDGERLGVSPTVIGLVNTKDGVNDSATGSGKGGEIENEGTLTLNTVHITNCQAEDGGAIYSTSTLALLGCTLEGANRTFVGGLNAGFGGGISLFGATSVATITGSVIEGNTASLTE